jgi:hypothetical protein
MKFGTAYFGNIILKHFIKDMQEVRRQGCSFIVLTFSEVDAMFHQETCRQMAMEAKRQGLVTLVDPWAIAGIFGGESLTQLPVFHDEERQLRSDGKRAPALCLNAPALTTYLKKWVDTVTTFGADYILWDEPHFYLNWLDSYGGWTPNPGAWSCCCDYCQKKFRKETGKPFPKEHTEEVKEFKRRSNRDFLLTLTRYAASKGQKNAMTFLPGEKEWFLKAMAQEKSIHVMGGETYFEYDDSRPKDIRQHAIKHTRELKVWSEKYEKPLLMWVKGFLVPLGFERDVVEAIKGSVDGGADWIAMWGFEGMKHVSDKACKDADKVWRLMGRTFRSYIKKSSAQKGGSSKARQKKGVAV